MVFPKIILTSGDEPIEIAFSYHKLEITPYNYGRTPDGVPFLEIRDFIGREIRLEGETLVEEFINKYGYLLCEKYKVFGFKFVRFSDFTTTDSTVLDYTCDGSTTQIKTIRITDTMGVDLVYANNLFFGDVLLDDYMMSDTIYNFCQYDGVNVNKEAVDNVFSKLDKFTPAILINSDKDILYNNYSQFIIKIDYKEIFENRYKQLKYPDWKGYINNLNNVSVYKLSKFSAKRILNAPNFNYIGFKMIPDNYYIFAAVEKSFYQVHSIVNPNYIYSQKEFNPKYQGSLPNNGMTYIPKHFMNLPNSSIKIRVINRKYNPSRFFGYYIFFGHRSIGA